jgi:hypothetical protein
MAKDLAMQDFHMKYSGWEVTAQRDEKTGQIINKVEMPTFPGLEQILENAEKMYAFVNQATNPNKK